MAAAGFMSARGNAIGERTPQSLARQILVNRLLLAWSAGMTESQHRFAHPRRRKPGADPARRRTSGAGGFAKKWRTAGSAGIPRARRRHVCNKAGCYAGRSLPSGHQKCPSMLEIV